MSKQQLKVNVHTKRTVNIELSRDELEKIILDEVASRYDLNRDELSKCNVDICVHEYRGDCSIRINKETNTNETTF